MVRRSEDYARRLAWKRRQVHLGEVGRTRVRSVPRRFGSRLPLDVASALPAAAREALLDAANGILAGRWQLLGVNRHDIATPDWFLDPISGRRAPQQQYAFRIDHRSEEETGNVKQVWELSRHHHLTVLSAAWYASGDDRYAETVARQLDSWWTENPFLSGVHWTSGIELGLRLIAWTWIRRLLDGWPGAPGLFERNDQAVRQIRWHQLYLSAFHSTGSSANNHAVAEAAGQLVASCAFPWSPESDGWRTEAVTRLENELERNTFPSGINRELASDYHRFVAELGLIGTIEALSAGRALNHRTWTRLCGMLDAAAALVDVSLRAPRQGDSDDGQVLVLDAPGGEDWAALLTTGAALFGPLEWWKAPPPTDVRSTLLRALTSTAPAVGDRPIRRTSHFGDAGVTLLRTAQDDRPEIWCRCDGGPHGYLAIAAHAHADALSVEVRHDGVDVLADPGTYCYHGETEWRSYFRSTLAHNTLELSGQDQSRSGGPFLWTHHAAARLLEVHVDSADGVDWWSAEHHGYARLEPSAVHRRTVRLDRLRRRLEVYDQVLSDGRHPCRLAFHLGPLVDAVVEGSTARLDWLGQGGQRCTATMALPATLHWTAHRAETEPILGWYSARFGHKQPSMTLLGTGTCGSGDGELTTVVEFTP